MTKVMLNIRVEKDLESGWLTASCPALPGCITQGKTEKELIENMKEAIALWFEVQNEKEMSTKDNDSEILELAIAI